MKSALLSQTEYAGSHEGDLPNLVHDGPPHHQGPSRNAPRTQRMREDFGHHVHFGRHGPGVHVPRSQRPFQLLHFFGYRAKGNGATFGEESWQEFWSTRPEEDNIFH